MTIVRASWIAFLLGIALGISARVVMGPPPEPALQLYLVPIPNEPPSELAQPDETVA